MMNPIRSFQRINGFVHPSERMILWLVLCVLLLGASFGINASSARGSTPEAGAAAGDPPVLLNYQGQLTDPQGVPQAGLIVSLKFRIYQQETGGVFDWSETHTSVYTDADGRFNVLLNSTGQANGDLASLLRDNPDLWLEVEVDNETLTPRQKVTSVGFALAAPWAGLTGMPLDFADGQDNLGLAGEGLNLSNGIFSLEGPYRLPQTCMYGQIAKWDNNSGTWVCGEDEQASYTAGSGLLLTGTTISVNYGGNGSAATVSRSDHTHAGQTWTTAAKEGLKIINTNSTDGSYALYGFQVGNIGSAGLVGIKGEVESEEYYGELSEAKGVYGVVNTYWGTGYGVYGEAHGYDAIGVYGEGLGYSGYGIYSKGNAKVEGNQYVTESVVAKRFLFSGGVYYPMSYPPQAFIPAMSTYEYTYAFSADGGLRHLGPDEFGGYLAPVQFPDGSIIDKMEFYWNDYRVDFDGTASLLRWNLNPDENKVFEQPMAEAKSSGAIGYGVSVDDTIENYKIDLSKYIYLLKVSIPKSVSFPIFEDFDFRGVILYYSPTHIP